MDCEKKNTDELLALYDTALREAIMLQLNIKSGSKTLNLEEIRQEIRRRLQEGKTDKEKLRIAEGKLRELAERAGKLPDPDTKPV